uniref:Uncharacterized protein n=1 Tax=mine drainage metagenome TaxID=410659 RepID=E6PX47_9ZZZZ
MQCPTARTCFQTYAKPKYQTTSGLISRPVSGRLVSGPQPGRPRPRRAVFRWCPLLNRSSHCRALAGPRLAKIGHYRADLKHSGRMSSFKPAVLEEAANAFPAFGG